MSIGYACVHIGSEKTKLSTLRLKNATDDNLRRVIGANLDALEEMIRYNHRNNIHLFRISSDIIPFGSHEEITFPWQEEFRERLGFIGEQIKDWGIRVSMHPGQYTVLNSTRPDVVKRAVEDLEYHCELLDALGCGHSCKIVLHVGGIYSDKEASMERFVENYCELPEKVKLRLIIENDDRSYNIEDVLDISQKTGIPVVFDNLHHALNKADSSKDDYEWIRDCGKTWMPADGKQKIHYSQQKPKGIPGAHSDSIQARDFLEFYEGLPSKELDIMLEVKDKNLSAIKCILLTEEIARAHAMEKEWARYKYFVLGRSAAIYSDIRKLFRDGRIPDPLDFYRLIEKALSVDENAGAQVNAAQHIWGYVKEDAGDGDKRRYAVLIDEVAKGEKKVKSLRDFLFRLAKKQSIDYLLESLYFYI